MKDEPKYEVKAAPAARAPVLPIWTERLPRPRHRADCEGGPRPCPYLTCEHNLSLRVDAQGAILGKEPEEGDPTNCFLDVCDDGGWSEEEIGKVLGIPTSEVTKLLESALRTLRHHGVANDLLDLRREFDLQRQTKDE